MLGFSEEEKEILTARINNCDQFLKLKNIELQQAIEAIITLADATTLYNIRSRGE